MARFTRKIGGRRLKRAGMYYSEKLGMGGTKHHSMKHPGKKHHKSHHNSMGGKKRRKSKKHHKKHHKKHGKKGSKSKTRHGHKNFITHKGSKVYNRAGHYQYRYPMPYKGM